MIKVTIIGAGSVIFAQSIITDILLCPELGDTEISLYDIDKDRLEVAEKIAKKIIKKLKLPAKVSSSINLIKALDGSDYVFCMIQVGGYESTLIDFDIPEKYGLKQTIGDTLGIGGIFRALRTIPVLLDLCKDMENVCPNALLINYTNPISMNLWSIYQSSKIKCVGLCHSVPNTSMTLANYINADYEEITFSAAGINHMAWFIEFKKNGLDAYPELFAASERKEIYEKDPVRFEIMRRFGYFVSESSEHMAEYVPYFMKDENLIREFKIPIREYLKRSKDIIDIFERQKAFAESSEEPQIKKSDEYGANVINSIETGEVQEIYGNVKNNGLITNLPDESCVVVPCLVDKNGLQPCDVGELPPQLAALNRNVINVQELTVKATLEKDKKYIYYAAMLDPLTSSILSMSKIYSMVDEMIKTHKEFLPHFQ